MNINRILTGVLGFPIIAAILILSNNYIFDIIMAFIAFIMMDEYCKSFKDQKIKPIKWISYISCIYIAILHIIPEQYMQMMINFSIPIIVTILFLHIILSNMKINIIDVSATLFGIVYIVFFFSFVSKLRGIQNGHILVWYIFMAAWGTDILGLVVGRHLIKNKHYFSQISPKKTIEGCIGGILGATLFVLIYTILVNNYFNMNINYYIIASFAVIWSIIGQIRRFCSIYNKKICKNKGF